MANRYFIEQEKEGQWEELPTRPLYSKRDAFGFIANLRNAPKGNWAEKNLRVTVAGNVIDA